MDIDNFTDLTAIFAKEIALHCVRNNTNLENLHAGYFPTTLTGDYSDVKVIDGEGVEIPWNRLMRISDAEMKEFIKGIVSNVYTFYLFANEPQMLKMRAEYFGTIQKFDEPEIVEEMAFPFDQLNMNLK